MTINLQAEFERLKVQPSDIHEHLQFFYDLVVELDAKQVIELGVRSGVSTVAFLAALETTGGELWSCDIAEGPGWSFPHWTFNQGDDIQLFSQSPESADIVFIDTSHTYDQTLRELELYSTRVVSGGFILLHDTELERPEAAGDSGPDFPVKRAIEVFCDANGFEWTNYPNCWGLGVIGIK